MTNYPTYKLGEVADYINGRAFKPSEWKENGLPIVRIQNLNDESAVYHYSDAEHEEKYLLHDGDLLFAWAASLGTYIWNGGEAWLNQHIFKVLPKQNVSKMYLYYALTSIIKELYSKSHGSGMVHVTKGKFEETEIPLPPLPTQHAIVTRIETLFAELDKAVQHLRTAQQQLKTYRQAVLNHWLNNDEGKWETVKLG
nr:restriction endonuclease subunit S [Bacteroidales bacterium]